MEWELTFMFLAGVLTDEAIRWFLRVIEDDEDRDDWPMDDRGAL